MTFFPFFKNLIGGLRRFFGLQSSAPVTYAQPAAMPVTFDTAMQLSAVWACVKLLSETVASLPLRLYRMTDAGRMVDIDHPLSILFGHKPNRYQTRVEFFETVVMSLVQRGNAYCHIQRTAGRITSLLPLMPSQVTVTLLPDGSVTYEYQQDNGVTVFSADSIWHLKLLGNGIIGLSPLDYQRNSLGIAQAAENVTTNIYRNGAKPSGVLMIDRVLTEEQREAIRRNFGNLTSGNDDRLMVLEFGTKFDPVSFSPQDIELLSSRRFQVEDICRWYGVPSVMINDTSATTVWGSGIAQIVEGFYKITLRPLLEKIEASIDANLLGLPDRLTISAEFDFEALLRTDFRTRLESYRIGIQGGMMTPNEARREEGRSDLPGGDQLYIQGATVPLIKAGAGKQFSDEPVEFGGR